MGKSKRKSSASNNGTPAQHKPPSKVKSVPVKTGKAADIAGSKAKPGKAADITGSKAKPSKELDVTGSENAQASNVSVVSTARKPKVSSVPGTPKQSDIIRPLLTRKMKLSITNTAMCSGRTGTRDRITPEK